MSQQFTGGVQLFPVMCVKEAQLHLKLPFVMSSGIERCFPLKTESESTADRRFKSYDLESGDMRHELLCRDETHKPTLSQQRMCAENEALKLCE